MIRTFRLTNEPGGLGLSCTPKGLSLAGVPLLHKKGFGFAPRPAPEIASLINAAYGADPTRLQSSLGVIADALNRGEFARAMIAAVLTRTPELDGEAAARLANTEKKLAKYDPNEPRDWHGRWTRGGAAGPASRAAPAGDGAASRAAPAASSRLPDLTPPAFTMSDEEADGDESRDPTSLEQTFESKYDELGPTEFAKEVTQFGDRLGREGRNFAPAEKERAAAEYAFLQDRLSLWLGYDNKPPQSQGHLLSAALTLYQGAIFAGIARADHLPASMLDVAGAAWAFDNLPPRPRLSREPTFEEPPPAPRVRAPRAVEDFGGDLSNRVIGIGWGKGNHEQGGPWETFFGGIDRSLTRQKSTITAFDYFNANTREAISVKTLNTQTANYRERRNAVLSRMTTYIEETAEYKRRKRSDLDPTRISSKTIQLAVPEDTTPEQWNQLYAAISYGRKRGVSVVITRITE